MAGVENSNINSSSSAAWNYSPAAEFSDDNAAGGSKKPAAAWSKKAAAAAEMEAEGGVAVAGGGSGGGAAVVMGAELWPALSESNVKVSPMTAMMNSAGNLPDLGANPPQKSTISTVNYLATPNQVRPARQKPIKREVGAGGGVNAQANGVFPQPPHNPNNFVKNGSSGAGGGSEGSGRDNNAPNHGYRESTGGMRNPGGDHSNPRGSFRRGNGGPHPRGDGSHQNYGGRRGDQDWNNQQRNFNGRDATSLQSRVSPRGYVRPTLGSAPFIHPGGPAPMRPFVNPMAMPDVPMIYFPPGMPLFAPIPPPMYYPIDPQLQAKIASQIDYYFSNENLIKDAFLRMNMDKDGWVSVSLIASFKKVKELTESIPLILDAISNSTVVEVKGDKIRRRDDYMRWVILPSMDFSTGSGTPSPKSPLAGLSAHLQGVSLDGTKDGLPISKDRPTASRT